MTDEAKKKILKKQSGNVTCPGCGEKITENDDLKKVEYVRTKRKTDLFIHTSCVNKVWNRVYIPRVKEE